MFYPSDDWPEVHYRLSNSHISLEQTSATKDTTQCHSPFIQLHFSLTYIF